MPSRMCSTPRRRGSARRHPSSEPVPARSAWSGSSTSAARAAEELARASSRPATAHREHHARRCHGSCARSPAWQRLAGAAEDVAQPDRRRPGRRAPPASSRSRTVRAGGRRTRSAGPGPEVDVERAAEPELGFLEAGAGDADIVRLAAGASHRPSNADQQRRPGPGTAVMPLALRTAVCRLDRDPRARAQLRDPAGDDPVPARPGASPAAPSSLYLLEHRHAGRLVAMTGRSARPRPSREAAPATGPAAWPMIWRGRRRRRTDRRDRARYSR